jgi:hypothetical protein
MTFSTLQTLTTTNPAVVPVADYTPVDDASTANRLAEYYRSKGMDPQRAYDTPDDALADFGGINGILH